MHRHARVYTHGKLQFHDLLQKPSLLCTCPELKGVYIEHRNHGTGGTLAPGDTSR